MRLRSSIDDRPAAQRDREYPNLTANNSSRPGTLSNIAFVASALGAVLFIVVGTATLIQSRRRQPR